MPNKNQDISTDTVKQLNERINSRIESVTAKPTTPLPDHIASVVVKNKKGKIYYYENSAGAQSPKRVKKRMIILGGLIASGLYAMARSNAEEKAQD